MSKKKRSRFSAKQRLQILKEAEASGEVSETCRRHGVSSSQFYRWKDRVEQAALDALQDRSGRPRKDREAERADKLEAELDRMRRVVAEITAENLEFKKRL